MSDVIELEAKSVLLKRIRNNNMMMKYLLIPILVCLCYSVVIRSTYFAVFSVLFFMILIALNLSIKIDKLRIDLMR